VGEGERERAFIDLEDQYNWTSSEEDDAGVEESGPTACIPTKLKSRHINTANEQFLR